MDCPRCKLALEHDRYEGTPVQLCKQCWGYWLDRGHFARITLVKKFIFTDEEKQEIVAHARAKTPATEGEALRNDAPIACPRCGKTMTKVHFNVKAPITVDRCESHGVWLDTHELKLAQCLAEDVAAVRQLFFQKLQE
jgi:Zn-finger nucleic acid-binding protein